MAASLDLDLARATYSQLQRLGLLAPLTGPPEAVMLDAHDSTVVRAHHMVGALNAAFNTLGLYHAVALERGAIDALYLPALRAPLLGRVIHRLSAP